MFTSKSTSVSTNTYCLAKTRRFSRRSKNSVRSVTQELEALTDTVELVLLTNKCSIQRNDSLKLKLADRDLKFQLVIIIMRLRHR